jgi:hypothetical protein
VLGAAVTLSDYDSGILVAFALSVAFAVSKLWTLLIHGLYVPLTNRTHSPSNTLDKPFTPFSPAPPESTAFEIFFCFHS